MLTVSSAAENTALTTVDAVKDRLSITATDEDAFLEDAVEKASAAICTWLNVAPASDGSATIGRETLIETFRLHKCQTELLLARPMPKMPVTISTVVEDGDTVETDEYELKDGGILCRLTSEDEPWYWSARKVVVTYVAGWLLPDDDGTNLPADIQDAAIGLVKFLRFNRSRDPNLRSENILESLYSYSLFAPAENKDGILPSDIAAQLAPYRNITL